MKVYFAHSYEMWHLETFWCLWGPTHHLPS